MAAFCPLDFVISYHNPGCGGVSLVLQSNDPTKKRYNWFVLVLVPELTFSFSPVPKDHPPFNKTSQQSPNLVRSTQPFCTFSSGTEWALSIPHAVLLSPGTPEWGACVLPRMLWQSMVCWDLEEGEASVSEHQCCGGRSPVLETLQPQEEVSASPTGRRPTPVPFPHCCSSYTQSFFREVGVARTLGLDQCLTVDFSL